MDSIKARLDEINDEIAEACRRSGRDLNEVKVIAVTKSHPIEVIRTALEQGLCIFGENRVQELIRKKIALPDEIEWHLIGTLQRNKVKNIIGKVVLIHSVDSYKLAQAISREALLKNIVADILLQVNIAGEISKYGFETKELLTEIKEISTLEGIKIKGLMTIAPVASDVNEARPVFKKLRMLAKTIEDMNIDKVEMKELSMGMSGDFTVAIEEGATLIRVGSRIFGRRNYV
jgi:pyridoxal phosphate enzyme (YggS family)